MQLEEYISRELIIPELSASTKEGVLAELVNAVRNAVPEFDAERALRVLQDRERLGTTGIGDGIAIPHGKMAALDRIVVVAARRTEGIEFDSLDGRPVQIVFLVLAPEHVVGMHLRILAHISRLLKDASFRTAFMQAPDGDALRQLLSLV